MASVSMLARNECDLHIPLYPKFNDVVLLMVETLLPDGFDVIDDETQLNSLKKLRDMWERKKRVTVWSGGSFNTIFGVPSVNHAFRAWHDAVHIWYNLPFSKDGEATTCLVQQRQVIGLCEGSYSAKEIELFNRILECEINGQVEYLNVHKKFPDNQREFHREWMKQKYGTETSTLKRGTKDNR